MVNMNHRAHEKRTKVEPKECFCCLLDRLEVCKIEVEEVNAIATSLGYEFDDGFFSLGL